MSRIEQASIAPFGLRMQPDLKASIEAAARQNNRSMNAEIVARLEASFDRSTDDRLDTIEGLLRELVPGGRG